jgi:prephenate dehydratase
MAKAAAFQGERGAYSEDAVLSLYPDAEPRPYRTLSEVFEAVESGAVERGVVPVENSQAGSINETYDLLLKHGLFITAEHHLEVVHCLLALPGQTLTDIKQVYSHPQALAQCAEYLRALGVEIVSTYDTAGSARLISEGKMARCAAVASERAGQVYGLTVLARRIQTNPYNFTRFLAISRESEPVMPASKTSVVFAVKNTPGTLYKALGAFATRGINLNKIESRPARSQPWQYVFYVDFDGHVEDPTCRAALSDLLFLTSFLKILGSYPKGRV